MFTKRSPNSFNTFKVTGVSLINALDFPLGVISAEKFRIWDISFESILKRYGLKWWFWDEMEGFRGI